MTQKELAELVGIHRTCPCGIERGTCTVGLVTTERLAGALSLPLSGMFRLAG